MVPPSVVVFDSARPRDTGGDENVTPGPNPLVSGHPRRRPAPDTVVALIGVITGLVAAALGSAAVLRQPPWPRMIVRPDHLSDPPMRSTTPR
ncbi:hypothetical protein GR168_12875 [Gordonia sp. JH63]|nr:hypothetical protein A8M60_17770 [Nocardia farcinica]QHD86165.1 hypothetical protein GR168_12875 [Gordonia sp. JH63]